MEPNSSVSLLGENEELEEKIAEACESYICNLYTKEQKAGSKVDDVRYWLFCQKGQKNEGLPPTSDSLFQHIKHATTRPTYGNKH